MEDELLISSLWEAGTAGVVEEEAAYRAYFGEKRIAAEITAAYASRVMDVGEELLNKAVIQPPSEWDPIFAGHRFWIAPPGSLLPTPPARLRLEIDSSIAFGTGRHESTQLALTALGDHLRPEHTFVDVGCGSGILSLAARVLGAKNIIACDLHEDAVTEAQRHGVQNVFRGSANALPTGVADLLVANISAKVIEGIGADLTRAVKQDGLLILAGFTKDRVPQNFSPFAISELNDWQCWLCHQQPGLIDRQSGTLSRVHDNWAD